MLPQAWPQPCPSGLGAVPVTLPPISMGLDPDGFSGRVRESWVRKGGLGSKVKKSGINRKSPGRRNLLFKSRLDWEKGEDGQGGF